MKPHYTNTLEMARTIFVAIDNVDHRDNVEAMTDALRTLDIICMGLHGTKKWLTDEEAVEKLQEVMKTLRESNKEDDTNE